MLLQFTVENFLSFREPATLSMVAADGVPHDAHQVMQGPGGLTVLRCVAIYGANASGKSNLVKSLRFALELIRRGTRAGDRIEVNTFRLDAKTLSAPSRFEFEIGDGARRYSYGFAVSETRVEEEWLTVTEGGAEKELLEREGGGANANGWSQEVGAALSSDPDQQHFLEFVARGTRPNQLFLSEAFDHNVSELAPLLGALSSITMVPSTALHGSNLPFGFQADTQFRDFLGHLLRGAGTGIDRLELRSSPDPFGVARSPLSFPVPDWYPPEAREVVTVHKRAGDEQPVYFRLDEESDGTRRLLDLAPALYAAQTYSSVIDELERSLHPLLTKLFLGRFLAPTEHAAQGSQLIFTTHDTNLLDLSLLSRDSIWFAEKDDAGATSLYSLAEFKPEQLDQLGKQLEKGYLQGRFGGTPYFGDLKKWRWVPPETPK